MSTSNTKLCPYCNEEINLFAKKCKHCSEWLDESAHSTQSSSFTSSDPTTSVKMALANKYQLLEKIGEGGMAVVYKAKQKNLERIIALKVIHQNLIHDKEFLERFHREARIAASLNHHNIVTIYDEGIENGVHFIAMEYLDGNDLYSLIKRKGKLTEEETINIAINIADALDYAHKKGIIHRDIKSANIILTKEGRVVLTDFGIARAVSGTKSSLSGSVIGTPEYMSPEQADGKQINQRSDLYSLGVVMYECLTGTVPFKEDNPVTTIYKIVNIEVPKIETLCPNISRWLSTVTQKCLVKSIDQRFESGKALSIALRNRSTLETYKPNIQESRNRQKETFETGGTVKITPEKIRQGDSKSNNMNIVLGGSILIVIIILIFVLVNQRSGKNVSDDNLNMNKVEYPVVSPEVDTLIKGQIPNDDENISQEDLLKEAHLLNDNGEYFNAINFYKRYLTQKPMDADARVDMGVCYFNLKEYENAKIETLRALEYSPRHQIGHLNLGVITLTVGNLEEAKEWLQRAVELSPNSEVGKRAERLIKTIL